MYGDTNNLPEVRKKLNAISPSFCMAKWMHSTIHLMNGTTHSCYLPPVHPIPLNEIARNPAAINNTSEKKEQRRQMLNGERPKGCHNCWGIEDLPGERISDRILRGSESWTRDYYDYVKGVSWQGDAYPTYLEVSFSPICNFKCSYCSPHVSTAWNSEIKEHGPYRLSQHNHQDTTALKLMGWMPIEDEDQNPYVDAFWKWWPEAYQRLHVFRVTGGEPLLSKHTFRLLDWVAEHPNPRLELDINSNLGIPSSVMDRFLEKTKKIVADKKVRALGIHTSLDNFGARGEYIRNGLNFSLYRENLEKYLTEIPDGQISFMCTFNALSVVGFEEFLDYVIYLREKFQRPGRFINLDLPHLTAPEHFSIRVLPPEYEARIEKIIAYMEKNLGDDRATATFRPMEVEKMRRVLDWMRVPQDENDRRRRQKDFYLFFKEHDRRRGTDFLKTFPDMKPFWDYCASL